MLKEKVRLYNYQVDATNFVLNNIDETHVLLAAAPNGGKTFMASFIINKLITNNSRVLCSVHGTNILKLQFYHSICEVVGEQNVSIYDTTKPWLYNPSKPVQVMVYQNIRQMQECVELYGEFDYLVVDEAHKFYDGTSSMETIAHEFVSGNHLLLTGSPAIFKSGVDSGEIKAKYISASLIESVHEGQYDKDIRLDVVSNDIHLTINDYNQQGEVTEKSQTKLINNEPVLDSLLVGDFGKTIIFVKRTRQADVIETYLNNRGIDNFVSHSKTDKDSENIKLFRENYTGIDNVVLIVVGRATEGFDDPNVSIIDITYSKNIDTLYQRYSRAIRNRTDAKDKRYVKVTSNNGNSAEVCVHIMTAVLMLLRQEHYENFNGKNFSVPALKTEIKKPESGVGSVSSYVPTPKLETSDISDNSIVIKSKEKPQSVKDLVENTNFVVNVTVDDNVYEIKSEDYNEWVNKLEGKEYVVSIEKSNDKVDDCLLMETKMYSGSFFDTKDELYGYITRYATNSLSDVLKGINGGLFASEQEHINFIKEGNIRGSARYSIAYKESTLKLHSTPWITYGNGSAKDYFESIWGSYASEQEHIDFIKDNNITSTKQYDKVYKESVLKLHSNPWRKYGNVTSTEYLEMIWGKKEEYASAQEHINFIKENNIKGAGTYSSKYKESTLNLHSTPWIKYGDIDSKGYFESIWGPYASEQEHIDFIKGNNITSGVKYGKKYRDSELKLHSSPWSKTVYGNGSEKGYFESIWGKTASAQEHIDFIKGNNITSGVKYSKQYKDSNLNLHSSPWSKTVYGNDSVKDYFESIWGKKEYGTEQEHITFIKENDIKTVSKYRKLYKYCETKLHYYIGREFGYKTDKDLIDLIWGKKKYGTEQEHIDFIKENDIRSSTQYKTFLKESTLKLHSKPWRKFGNGSLKDYLESIWGKKEEYASAQEHIDFIKENNITNGENYKVLYKESGLNLNSKPWRKFGNGSVKDYFKSIWEDSKQREYKPAYLGEFSEMNKKWNTSNSETTHQRLKEDKTEWVKYHKLYSNSRKNWDEIPFEVIGKMLKDRPEWIVGDFGCGENLLSKEISNKVHAFDHIAIDDDVVSCDITNVPLEDGVLDVVVFSLSLMGTNYKDYLKEAHRVLKSMGMLIISEPSKRWEDRDDEMKGLLTECGFHVTGDIKHNEKFIYVTAVKF